MPTQVAKSKKKSDAPGALTALPAWAPRVALGVLLAGAVGYWLATGWGQTMRREAYLPELQQQAAKSPTDGPLLALLGARLSQAGDRKDQADAIPVLVRAISSGEQGSEQLWLVLAATNASMGGIPQATKMLTQAHEVLGAASGGIDAAQARVSDLPANPSPTDIAKAISPHGADDLVAAYTQGSMLNGIVSWWGRRHPEQSGTTTRMKWAAEEPRNAEAQRYWGLALIRNRRVVDAVPVLSKAAELAPKSAPVQLALGQAFETLGGGEYAIAAYLRAVELSPRSLPALLALGRSCTANGMKYDRFAFQQATRVDPKSIDAWVGLGTADSGRDLLSGECITAFEAAQRLEPSRTDFYDDFAQALSRSGDQDRAQALLTRRLAAQPDDAGAHYLLADSLVHQEPTPDHLTRAEAEVREALKSSPGSPVYLHLLGDVQLRSGRAAEAVETLKTAVSANPYLVEGRRLLSRAYASSGSPALAAQEAERAKVLSDTGQQIDVLLSASDERYLDPQFHQSLIRLYQQTGKIDQQKREQKIVESLQHDSVQASIDHITFVKSIRAALNVPDGS